MKLTDYIMNYHNNDVYPFHMPGHKRNREFFPQDLLNFDMTEIPGMDNLNCPSGIILDAEKRLSEIYGSDESFFVVNGSSGAVISAICATAFDNTKVLVARNCHRSVYSGLIMSGARPVYIAPRIAEKYGICGGIAPYDVERELNCSDDISAVIITSPTYEGIVSDIKSIAEIVHRKNKILIVDEAHGAHFVFSDYFPKSAIQLDADIVVQSLHKTLPALTQTAVLHIKGGRVPSDRIKTMLTNLQTSSPSYIFLAYADYSLNKILSEPEIFSRYIESLENFRRIYYNKMISLVGEDILKKDAVYEIDRGKLVFVPEHGMMTGFELERELFEVYKIQIEMSTQNHIVALTSPADTQDGFERLLRAVSEISQSKISQSMISQKIISQKAEDQVYNLKSSGLLNLYSDIMPEIVFTPRECLQKDFESVPLSDCAGRISHSLVTPYPPGVPLLVPGERITKKILSIINSFLDNGVSLSGYKNGLINVVRR